MKEQLDAFLVQVPDLASKTPASLIEVFVYFLTVIQGQNACAPSEVEECFRVSRLPRYSNVPAYLSNNSVAKKGKKPVFVRSGARYELERNRQLQLEKTLQTGPARVETSHLLRGLVAKLSTQEERDFLQEAIDCYEIGAKRAAIVMVWILTMHHLFRHIFAHGLAAFNAELAKVKDKRVKVSVVTKLDDFSDIPEGIFIELTRAAGIISNDVRKILDTKLGIRNTSAHPSGVKISEVKATEFITDLVENVILKYPA
jgi:hypothetical protein